MKILIQSFLISSICVCIASQSCQAQPPASDPSVALLAEDKAWADAIRGDLTKALSYWDDDAIFYRHGLPVLSGIKEISRTIKKNRETPGFVMSRVPKHAYVAASGDLGYTTGQYTLTLPGENGSTSTHQGNYLCVWQKKSDAWKCVSAMSTRDNTENITGNIADRNKEIVKMAFKVVGNGDYDKMDLYIANNYLRHSQATPGIHVTSLGEFKEFIRQDRLAIPDQKIELKKVIAENDMVAFWATYKGTQTGQMGPFPPSNKYAELDFSGIHRLKDGKIVESWVTWDNLAILSQLGHFSQN